MDGDEVIQLYIHDVKSRVEREIKALKGFERVNLKMGASKEIFFKIDKSHLSFYDAESKNWVAERGQFEVLIGSSSRDILATSQFTLK
ncbi:MAG: fibronectin type III-like domain-contianing protein [Bacteroidia bacterium]|nr:fibronectin type III-like domain-contianing protein [Bacteroidia bacterium]